MKIRFEKDKKLYLINKLFNKHLFYKFYFFFTLILLLSICFLFFQTGIWEKNKREFLKKIDQNGIANYIYLPEIFFYKLNSFFETQKKNKIRY